jgi:hypothetical protein
MAHAASARITPSPDFTDYSGKTEASTSAVSWPAIIAGAFVVSALSLILLALGAGVGLSSISPWTNQGVSASTVGKGAIVWMILVQIIASAMGGYLAGRLRTKWVAVHSHEVYFRDTAHGFLVWSVGLVVTAAFLASAATSMVSGTPSSGSGAGAGTAVASAGSANPTAYFADSLFRSDRVGGERADTSIRAEAALILARGLRQGDVPEQDRAYLAQLVASHTGMSQAEGQRRVSEVIDQDRQAADEARRSAAHLLYWTFLALLIGAFCASYAATIGGRQRDELAPVGARA